MVNKINGQYRVRCDFCPAVVEFPESLGYSAMWAQAKLAGWRAFTDEGDVWKQKCPVCVKAYRKPRETEAETAPEQSFRDSADEPPDSCYEGNVAQATPAEHDPFETGDADAAGKASEGGDYAANLKQRELELAGADERADAAMDCAYNEQTDAADAFDDPDRAAPDDALVASMMRLCERRKNA